MPGSITFGPRDLYTLLLQTSAVKVSELSEQFDAEVLLEGETGGSDATKAAKVAGAVAGAVGTVVAADTAVTAVTDATTQTGAYNQADVQSIVALANDLKAKYNVAVTLINELKTDLNANATVLTNVKAKVDLMNA